MNIGSVPGYYFDEEKEKYFRIQPGHKLPTQTKYTFSNVQKEARARQRVKRAQEDRKRSHSRIVSGLPGRHHGSSLLKRESSLHNGSQLPLDIDDVLVANLEFSKGVHLWVPPGNQLAGKISSRVQSAYILPHLGGTVVQFHRYFEYFKYDRVMRQHDVNTSNGAVIWNPAPAGKTYYASDSSTYLYDIHSRSRDLCWESLTWDTLSPHPVRRRITVQYSMHLPICVGDMAVSTDTKFALLSTLDILLVDMTGAVQSHLALKKEGRSIDWLNHNTIAASQEKEVRLWDVRTRDSSKRIRHNKRITGVKTVKESDGSQLLISDNYGIRLHDLRMTSKSRDRYPLSFHGVHGGPRAHFDVNSRGLVAAYLDEQLKIFSLNSGRQLRAFELPVKVYGDSDISQLNWQEDGCGSPFIQMCTSEGLWRWASRTEDDD